MHTLSCGHGSLFVIPADVLFMPQCSSVRFFQEIRFILRALLLLMRFGAIFIA
jgi:hypothetical protein